MRGHRSHGEREVLTAPEPNDVACQPILGQHTVASAGLSSLVPECVIHTDNATEGSDCFLEQWNIFEGRLQDEGKKVPVRERYRDK